ncbi:MAG: sigma-70 family RNA polymerase sigma factor [Myxococcota bacterium]
MGIRTDRELLDAALAGDRGAGKELVDRLAPVVQIRVARLLRRRGVPRGRDARQEMQDLVQDVFARLFANNARALRGWDPTKGANLSTFVGIIADREVVSILRTAKRSPFTEEPQERPVVESRVSLAPRPDEQAAARQSLDRLLDRLAAELSPLGYRVFELLWCEERSVEDVCAELELSRDAVYAWRSRIRKLARKLSTRVVAAEAS